MEVTPSTDARDVLVLAKNFVLTRPQFDLLSKGLSYIPTLGISRDQKIQLQLDLQNYHRKIKLAAHFRDSEDREALPFTGPSNWTPSLEDLPPEIEKLVQEDLKSFKEHYKTIHERSNISLLELKALNELKNCKHIVIKPADKGSAVVILNRDQYIFEIERQLNDTEYYKKLEKPIYRDTIPMVSEIVDVLKKKKFINARQRQYLVGNLEPRERRFYILPKIHKDPERWTIPHEIPPGRPIVSDCGSETYFTAEYLDYHLNPLSIKHPAYVRDTYHFVEIVHSLRIPSDSEFFFFSMDVESLYTNIPIQAGIACIRKAFEEHPDPKRPDEELLKLLHINLTRNDFMFNGKYYLQIKGTAMGKKFAPAYANIFMAYWEKEAFLKCKAKPAYYLRYLDDIWGIWTGSSQEFEDFVRTLNSHDPSIRLKTEVNNNAINFLDTTVFKGPQFSTEGRLEVKVFFKGTDTHALLHKNSFHPKHTFRGIVKSQLLRFKRICSRGEHFMEAVQVLFAALRKRGYGRTFLRRCLKTFQERKARDHEDIIPLITTFSSAGRILNRKFKSNYERVLGQERPFSDSVVISAFRRNKNLRDLLVHAKLSPLTREKPQKLETQFSRLKYVRNVRQKTVFKIAQGFSTRTCNCVYLIFCSICGIQYVGETGNTLSTRMMQHRYNIKNKKEVDTPLVKHFLLHGLSSVRLAGLQKDINWSDVERKNMERRWIYLLGTKQPFGLNINRNL